MSVNHNARTGGKIEILSTFFNMKVYCVFPLELPHRGDSSEYTKYTIFINKKEITLHYPKSAVMGFFSKGLKNEFETAVVKEPSVFEPQKFCCICLNTNCGYLIVFFGADRFGVVGWCEGAG